jgi:hypothetical protein
MDEGYHTCVLRGSAHDYWSRLVRLRALFGATESRALTWRNERSACYGVGYEDLLASGFRIGYSARTVKAARSSPT